MLAQIQAIPRFVGAVIRRFFDDNCLLHASALAYTTLLSLVPLLALMFSVLKGLGVQRRLEPLLLSRLALTPDMTEQIIGYIDATNVATLGALGAALLVLTVISVLGAVESSLNHIWRVHEGRTYWRMVTDYLSAFLLAPMLLLAVVAVTSGAQEQSILGWLLQEEFFSGAFLLFTKVVPIFVNALAIGVLYGLMPNRRPNVPAIVLGALVAGLAWYAVQTSYVALQVGVARYNAIYGALAQLPVTLVGIYITWTVVLLGAEVAAVYEFGSGSVGLVDKPGLRSPIAIHVLLRAAESFRHNGKPVNVADLARELQVETNIVASVIERLRGGGLLAPVEDNGFILARDPASINLGILNEVMDPAAMPVGVDPRVEGVMRRMHEARVADTPTRLSDLLQTPPVEASLREASAGEVGVTS
jgi:membrane protein